MWLNGPPFVFPDDGGDRRQQVEIGELLINALVGPMAEQAEFVAVLEPVNDLLDGGLFEIGRQSSLSGTGSGAGHDEAAGVSDAALLTPRTKGNEGT